MFYRIQLSIVLLVLAFLQPVIAQIPEVPQNIQSPNAFSFNNYGNIPVSLFSGKPDISVNLHTLTEGNIQIPITLHYDPTGVKPDLHSGWTGLNFSLSTQYAVTRTVNDGPDDSPEYGSFTQTGYWIYSGTLNTSDWLTDSKMQSNAWLSLTHDLEPDEFNFSAPGLSGKFYRGHDGQLKIASERPVKVEIIGTSADVTPPFSPPVGSMWQNYVGTYRTHTRGFLITDEWGNKYEFGGGNNAYMEYSMDFFNQFEDSWTCNAWYLKSITRSTGQIINFTYERGNFVAQIITSVYNRNYSVNGSGFLNADCSSSTSIPSLYGAHTGKLVSPIYLKEINSDNYRITFTSTESTELGYEYDVIANYIKEYDIQHPGDRYKVLIYLYNCMPSSCYPDFNPLNSRIPELMSRLKWRKLDNIAIKNTSGSIIKEFIFTYNNVSDERLMLEKVQEKSGYNSSLLPAYEFTYYSDNSLSLPGYCASHTDHWGYNNGKLIDINNDYGSPVTYGDNFRNPATDPRLLLLGSLTSIKYPTGGRTDFVFEPNSYTKEVKMIRSAGLDTFTIDQTAGGLRIREIHSYQQGSASPELSKRYYYVNGFQPESPDTTSLLSSGIVGGKVQYWWTGYQPKPDGSYTYTQDVFSSQSVLPTFENSMGMHIGYTEVVEYNSDNGWKIHTFSNFDNGYPDEDAEAYLQLTATPYQPFNSMAYKRSKPLSIRTFTQNGALVYKQTIQYAMIGTMADHFVRSLRTKVTKLCNLGNDFVYEATAFIIDTRKFLPMEETTYIFDQQDDTRSYFTSRIIEHKTNGQIKTIYTSDSKTHPIKIPVGGLGNIYNRQIATGYTYPNDLTDATSTAMTGRHMIGYPIEINRQLALAGSSLTFTPLKSQKITYALFNTLYLPSKVETRLWTGSYYTDIEFLNYDTRGNLLIYRPNNGSSVVLEYYGVADSGKTDWVKNRTEASGTLIERTDQYNYTPSVGITSITDPNNKTLYYEYDDFNRLKHVRNTNASGSIRSAFCYNYASQTATPCTALAPTGSIASYSIGLIAPYAPPLPITLVSFEANAVESMAVLQWNTTEETGFDRFEIERSPDGKNWTRLGVVLGKSEMENQYTFSDHSPLAGENLYRLKMADKDDSYTYSPVRSLTFDQPSTVLYPNPVTIDSKLKLLTPNAEQIAKMQLYDTEGRLLMETTGTELDTRSLSPGLYMVQITYTDSSISTHRIIKH